MKIFAWIAIIIIIIVSLFTFGNGRKTSFEYSRPERPKVVSASSPLLNSAKIAGEVITDGKNVVSNANVTLIIIDSKGLEQKVETQTDKSGKFTFSVEGFVLAEVKAKAQGYYSGSSAQAVLTKDQENYANIKLILRKITKPVQLHAFEIKQAMKDGSATIEILGRKIHARYSSEEFGETKFRWRLILSVEKGGFLETSEEFPFLAPEFGYVPEFELAMNDIGDSWSYTMEKRCFVKFDGPLYGFLVLRSVAVGDKNIYLKGVINPRGSNNLEPLSALKAVEAGVYE